MTGRRRFIAVVAAAALAPLAAVISGSWSVASAGPTERQDTIANAWDKLRTATFEAFGQRSACVLSPRDADGELIGVRIHITSRRQLPRTRRLVKEVGGDAFTTIGVVSTRYSYGKMQSVYNGTQHLFGTANPDVSVSEGFEPDLRSRCPAVVIALSPGAPQWVVKAADTARRRYGTDRVRIRVRDPGEVVPDRSQYQRPAVRAGGE